MKRQLRDAWVKALRSGEYKQTTNALCALDDVEDASTIGYCCLGVLCDIAVDGEWILTPFFGVPSVRTGYRLHVDGYEFEGDLFPEAFPPRDPNPSDLFLLNQLGLTRSINRTLAEMNDTGTDFDHLADWIEQNVKVDP